MQKADTLRIQYEHQVSTLQRQLEAERRNSQDQANLRRQQYDKLVSELRSVLGPEHNTTLDAALTQLSFVHSGEIKRIQSEHQNDTCLEVTALKLSLEQMYATKTELEVKESKLRYEQKLQALESKHKEEVDRLSTDGSAASHGIDGDKIDNRLVKGDSESTQSLTERYNALIERLSEGLEQHIPVNKSNSNNFGVNGDVPHDKDDNEPHTVVTYKDLQEMLHCQRADVLALKTQLASTNYNVNVDCPLNGGTDGSDLEHQLTNLHQQYQAQVEQIQHTLRLKNETQEQESAEHREELEKQHEQLKSHYENKVEDMEKTFETQIAAIKEKYEAQISELIHSRLMGDGDMSRELSEERDDDAAPTPTAFSTPQQKEQREYIHKTTVLTAVSDTDSDMSLDMPRNQQPEDDYVARLKVLEAELVERDSQLNELRSRLGRENGDVCSQSGTLSEVEELRQKVSQLQKDASEALARCSQLQDIIQQLEGEQKDLNIVLEEKDEKIQQLEVEKSESEKLYKELLEKESPRSKGSQFKEAQSGSSVDDSFTSARDYDTPRSFVSDHLDFTSPRPDLCDEERQRNNSNSDNNTDHTQDLSDSIPFANDSSDYANANSNANNNNNSSMVALELAVEDLKKKVEELDAQLAEAKAREQKLQEQIEDSDHRHKESIEILRQELDHEKQVEVETLQSEFRVQLEVELKRQAAKQNVEEEDYQTFKTADMAQQSQTENDDCSNNNASVEEPLLQNDCQSLFSTEEKYDSGADPLLQTTGFDPQQFGVGNSFNANKESRARNMEHLEVSENISHVSESIFSMNSQANADASSMPVEAPLDGDAAGRSITDLEKAMAELKEEYEAKLAELRTERDAAEARYDRLMQGIQDGDHPELEQLMKDKYDDELEFTKSLLQQDYDAQLVEEKKKFVEKHRKLMTDFMSDREKEEEEANAKHEAELNSLRESLTRQYEEKLGALEQQEERDAKSPAPSSTFDHTENRPDTTLSESQADRLTASPVTRETSTPNMRADSVEVSTQWDYEESEDETEVERAPTRQVRSFADVVKAPSPQSTQEMEAHITQLKAQVERLTFLLAHQASEAAEGEACSAEAKTPTRTPQHSPENDTLRDEDSALVAMLQSDLERISAERESVQRTNDRLLSLLSDSVKTYVGVEDSINRKLSQVVAGSTPRTHFTHGEGGGAGSRPVSRPGSVEPGSQSGREDSPAHGDRKGATPDADSSQDSHQLENTSILSNATDEGLEISQRLAESIFVGPDLDEEGEEILSDARGRLTSAVGQLLELMERSTVQLVEAKATQQDLLETLAGRAREMETVTARCSDLESQLAAEGQAKDYLGLELHKAEGLIAGYSAERESMEGQIQSLEEQRETLIVDLDTTRSRLDEFHRSQTEIDSAREDLGRQQELLRDNAGEEMQALLAEVSSLSQEKRELAEQLQHQLDVSRQRLVELEGIAEETERRHEVLLEEKVRQIEDIKLQLENTERQLKASKAFVAEQISEREQEREEHQREIERLEEQLQGKDRNASSHQRLQREIADLNEQLQARMTSQNNMHQRTLELQKALEDKELSTHDLKAWVSQLESELDQRGNVEDELKIRISKLEQELSQHQGKGGDTEQVETATETSSSLTEGSIETLSPSSSRRPWTAQLSLEEEVLRVQKNEEELQHENRELKAQVQHQLVQISGLRNELDQLRNYGGDDADGDVSQLRARLQTERDALEKSDAQVSEAQNKIDMLETLLKNKQEETVMIREKVSRIMQMGDAHEENETLRSQLGDLQDQISHLSNVTTQAGLPPALLEEKNAEIQELQSKLDDQTKQQQVLQSRLKEKDEEISDLQDSISSLRRGETSLDVSLPFNEDANNLLNISMTGRTTRSARAVTPTSIHQELEDTMLEREGELDQLRKELSNRDEEIIKLEKDLEEKEKRMGTLTDTQQDFENQVYELTVELEELRQQSEDHQQELAQLSEERDKAQEQLNERDAKIDQMMLQVDSLQEEISSLTTFQNELQKDFDTVQTMLDDKEKELESLAKELTDTKTQQETLDTVLHLEKVVASLEKDLQEKQNVVEEKEEDLEELRDKLEEMGDFKKEITTLQVQVSDKDQQLLKEQESVAELQETLAKERQELEDVKNQLKAELETAQELAEAVAQKDRKVMDQEQEISEHIAKIKEQKSKIEELEKGMIDMQEKTQDQSQLLVQQLEKTTSDYEKRIISIEEQLRNQSESYAALQSAAEHTKSLEENVNSQNQMIQEKESALQSLQDKLQEKTVKYEDEVERLKSELDVKERDNEKQLKDLRNEHEKHVQDLINEHSKSIKELKNYHEQMIQKIKSEEKSQDDDLQDVRRHLKETEDRLRLRQSALLDAQAENEQLSQVSNEVDNLKQQLEEKQLNIETLEGQLRFRQSCILDMEAERERVLEDRDEFEAELKQEIAEKEKLLQDMQEKYTSLKEEFGKHDVLHMETELQRSSQSRLVKSSIDNDKEVDESEELQTKLKEALNELSSLKHRKWKVEQRLEQTNHQLVEREEQLQQLQSEMQQQSEPSNNDAHDTQLRLLEAHNTITDLEAQLKDAEARIENDSDKLAESHMAIQQLKNEMKVLKAENISDYEVKKIEQLEQLVKEQKTELEEKKHDLEVLEQATTSQSNLQQNLQRKDEEIESLQTKLTAAEEQLADSQAELFQLREKSQEDIIIQQPKSGECLSPETKQSISHLKSQLRKAHTALEEMRTGAGEMEQSEMELSVQQEMDRLHEALVNKDKELAILKSRLNEPESVEEQRTEQERCHQEEMTGEQIGRNNRNANSTGVASSRSSISLDDSMPQRLQALLQRLNSLGEHLVSVSDLDYLQQHLLPDAQEQGDTSAWSQERKALMDEIDALKDLLQQADKAAKQNDEEQGDWRSDLLTSLVSVYEKERRILQAEVNTADSMFPEVDIISQLEARIHDLEKVHQNGLDEMLASDRQSLLDEVDNLHHRLLEAKAELTDARDSLDARVAQLEEAKASAEWKLQKQLELLEYKLQQESVVQEDLRKSLRIERGRVTELSQQSSKDRTKTLELQEQLSSTQISLSKARDTLEREQQKFTSVTDALEEERAKTNRLAELLDAAKKRLSTAEEDIAQADARYQHKSNSEEEYIQELKSQLARERQRSARFSNGEEEAKGQVTQLTNTLEHLKAKVTALRDEYESKLEDLRRENAELMTQEQKGNLDKEAVAKMTQLLDEERESHVTVLQEEKDLNKQLRKEADHLRATHSKQQKELESEHSAQLESFRRELSQTRQQVAEQARRADLAETREETQNSQRIKEVEKDKDELRERVAELESELSKVQDRARQLEIELAQSQTEQDKVDSRTRQGHRQAINTLLHASVVDQELKYRLGQCCSKLQVVAAQLHAMAQQQNRQQRQQYSDGGDDAALTNVMTELDKLREEIREKEQERVQNGSNNGFHEQDRMEEQMSELVKHNQQLAERVVRLTQDKEHLSNSLALLENRLTANVGQSNKNNVKSLPHYVSDVTSDEETVYDRTVWASEKLSLQMALDSAEHEIQRLRTEIQQFRKLVDTDGNIVTVNHDKTTRLYGKFLRAESFRKALVYQKKYLLLLLGGYRDTEQETLAILASMGGFPSPGVGLGFRGPHSRAFTVFRSAGRTVIAIFRMKYLVRKWKRATRVGSPVVMGQITQQQGYLPTSASYPGHQRHITETSSRHRQPASSSSAQAANHHPYHLQNHQNHPIGANSNSSSYSIEYIDSLSNGQVSTLVSNPHYLGGAAARGSPHAANSYSTPPTKHLSSRQSKSLPRGNRDDARRRVLNDEAAVSSPRHPTSARLRNNVTDKDDDNFLNYLEKVKQQLSDSPSPTSRRSGWR